MIITQTQEQVKITAALHQHAEISRVRLARALIETHQRQLKTETPTVTVGYKAFEIRPATDAFSLNIEFTLNLNEGGEMEAGMLMRIAVVFEVTYTLLDGYQPSEDQLSFFAAGNAVFNLWPFFREYVQNTAARAGMPSLTVPLLRVKVTKGQPAEQPVTTEDTH